MIAGGFSDANVNSYNILVPRIVSFSWLCPHTSLWCIMGPYPVVWHAVPLAIFFDRRLGPATEQICFGEILPEWPSTCWVPAPGRKNIFCHDLFFPKPSQPTPNRWICYRILPTSFFFQGLSTYPRIPNKGPGICAISTLLHSILALGRCRTSGIKGGPQSGH